MITDPLTNTTELAGFVKKHYDLPVLSLVFLPFGEDGALYKLTSSQGEYIAKLIGIRRAADRMRIEKNLAVVYQLAQQDDFTEIVSPIPQTNGELSSTFFGYTLAVYPFIDGRTQHERGISPQELEQIGRFLGRLHNSNRVDTLSTDELDISLALSLEKHLSGLESGSRNLNRELQKTLIHFLKKNRVILQNSLDTLQTLKKQLPKSKRKMVVSHTDLSPGNILFTPSSNIKIIDWETIQLSLPEQDVNLFSDTQHLRHFLPSYIEATDNALDIQAFAFFKYRWDLEGFAERIQTLCDEKASLEQQAHDFRELSKELEGHKSIELGLEKIEELLELYR